MTPICSNDDPNEGYEISDPAELVKHPVVSVLMLAYNHGSYLAQAIDGVLAQQAEMPIELLIGEDCSTDNTRDIALRYQRAHPGVIRVFTAERNVGSTLNHRRILLAARGEFIAYLDGDDSWLPGKLLRQVKYLREHSGCAAVFANALTVDKDNREIGIFNDVRNEQFDLGALLRRGNFLNNSSVVYRASARAALLEIEAPAIDYRGHLLLAREGFLAQLSEPMVIYRIGSTGSMVTHGNNRVRQLYWEAIMSVPRNLVTDDDLACGIADFVRRVFFRSLRTRRIELLKEWIPRAFAASPYGTMRTALLVFCSVVRIACKDLLGRIRRKSHGRFNNVLYRR
ncbi:MAG: glycosyltransferase [Rhodanobacter lindaniclasticus]